MKKVFFLLAFLGFVNLTAEAQCPYSSKATAKTAAVEKKSCAKTCTKTAAATAAKSDDSIVEKVCAKSGAVSYQRKNVCAASGKVSFTDVEWCTKSAKFVNASPSQMKAAACSKAKATSASNKAACSKSKKACCAKGKSAKSAATPATDGKVKLVKSENN